MQNSEHPVFPYILSTNGVLKKRYLHIMDTKNPVFALPHTIAITTPTKNMPRTRIAVTVPMNKQPHTRQKPQAPRIRKDMQKYLPPFQFL